MQVQVWKPLSVLLPFTSWMWASPVGQTPPSLPFAAPHYPQCFTRHQPLPLPSLTQRKSKKRRRHPSPLPTKHHQWKEAVSAGSLLPAKAGEVVQCQLRCFKPWWMFCETLCTFSCDLLLWDLTGQIPLTLWDLPKTFTWGCTDAGPQHRRNTYKSTELIYCCWSR